MLTNTQWLHSSGTADVRGQRLEASENQLNTDDLVDRSGSKVQDNSGEKIQEQGSRTNI